MRFLPAILFLLLPALHVVADPVVLQMPDDSRALAGQARASFDQGRFFDAEKAYQQILQKHPDNLYAVSNLGVVYFRIQKWKLAESSLQKALTIAPRDAFSHFTLGIVYYQESRHDAAVAEVIAALAINPNYPTAYDFLKILRADKNQAKPSAVKPVRTYDGDFLTPHERQLRQPSLSPVNNG